MSWLVHPAGRYFATVTHTVIFHCISPHTAFPVTVLPFLAFLFPLMFTLCLLLWCVQMWMGPFLATHTHKLVGFTLWDSIKKEAQLGAGGKSKCFTTTPSCLVSVFILSCPSLHQCCHRCSMRVQAVNARENKHKMISCLFTVDSWHGFYWLVLIG